MLKTSCVHGIFDQSGEVWVWRSLIPVYTVTSGTLILPV